MNEGRGSNAPTSRTDGLLERNRHRPTAQRPLPIASAEIARFCWKVDRTALAVDEIATGAVCFVRVLDDPFADFALRVLARLRTGQNLPTI